MQCGLIPYCPKAAWHIIPTICWLLRLLISQFQGCGPLTFLPLCLCSCAGVLLPLLLAVALRGHLVFCTNWLHVLSSLGLLPDSSILRILPQICPLHMSSLASLYQQSCSGTLLCMLLILSIHITSKTSLWPASLLSLCWYLLHTQHRWSRHNLMILVSSSFTQLGPDGGFSLLKAKSFF